MIWHAVRHPPDGRVPLLAGAPAMVLALLLALTLAGCRVAGGPSSQTSPTSSGTSPTSPGPSASHEPAVPYPGDDAVVLRIEHRGGFVPDDFHLTRLPVFTLLGDGRVIVTGAVPAIYPGPMLPPLLERRLTEAGVQAVVRAALDSGQLDTDAEWRGAANVVADASDTVFILNAAGRQVTVSVYALNLGEAGDWGLKKPERDAHAALAELSDKLTALDTWLPATAWAEPEWQPYRADALRLVVRPADGDAPGSDGLPLRIVPWPVPGDPAEFGERAEMPGWRCGVVTGAAASTWYSALEAADQLTRWEGGGHRYQVTPRPLLPDESQECAPLL
jgi:hypothetical protein